MYGFMEIIFSNIVLIVLIVICLVIYKKVKDLKEKESHMKDAFTKKLNVYLEEKIKTLDEIAKNALKEYGREDATSTDINRLLLTVDKGINGTINEKVAACNAINKFKLNKDVDYEKYPFMAQIRDYIIFSPDEMDDLANGLSLAHKEYNASAVRYNLESSAFPINYIIKMFGMPTSYVVFDQPKQRIKPTEEVLEMAEPEINAISSMNVHDNSMDIKNNEVEVKTVDAEKEIKIEHTSNVFKASINVPESVSTEPATDSQNNSIQEI